MWEQIRLSKAVRAPSLDRRGNRMKQARRVGLVCLIVAAAPALAQAAGRAPLDPDWPCQQPKVADYPLASVWDGPPIEAKPSDDPAIRELAAQMSQRRVPMEYVRAAVARLASSSGPEAKEKIKQAFVVAFNELVRQRAEVIAGLDRVGRKQRETAERIRAENDARGVAAPAMATQDAALQKLQWDMRVYEDRRRTVSYVCEAPQAIEARIGEIVKVVRGAL
jgi:hypothetical protein